MSQIEQTHRKRREVHPDAAKYAVSQAHKRRYLMALNLKELYHIILQRTTEHGHPGYRRAAMAMFEEIQKPDNVREYLKERLKSGRKIFGLGHRIYRGIDPRAAVLRAGA